MRNPTRSISRSVLLLLVLGLCASGSWACGPVDQGPVAEEDVSDASDANDPNDTAQDPNDTAQDPNDTAQDTGVDTHTPVEPGTTVTTALPPAQQAELDRLVEALRQAGELTLDGFRALHPQVAPFAPSYTPSQAAGMDTVQASALALDADELAALDAHGFVITERTAFPSFVYGYQSLYVEDLPLYVSADSILHAVHRSYDDMLKAIEVPTLSNELDAMLTGMRAQLAAGAIHDLGVTAEADADLYLAVALTLLRGAAVEAVAGADPAQLATLVASAQAASGWQKVALFGVERDMDFSQFTVRGHYTDSEELGRYFKAMMWLGRVDLRLLETQPDLTQVFHRRQFEGMLALHALLDAATKAHWQLLEDTIATFVGESDNMTLNEVDGLLADLQVGTAAAAAQLADATIAQAIVDGGYGTQRISSHIMINGVGAATMPLSSTFLLLGQRYVVDSHVFSNLVYDRVGHGSVMRMMPNPLDAAYAALSNDQAAALLGDELQEYGYQGDLRAMRLLVDAHGSDYWQSNLYNLWLGSLRALSPSADDVADPAAAGLPAIMVSEAWGRRLLNTQLASWAELRHDTILYAKQSYTAGATCEFPDAYVDPYPEFFQALLEFAAVGRAQLSLLDLSSNPWLAQRIDTYFIDLESSLTVLEEMARFEREGRPFSDAHLAFINEAVVVQMGCGDPAGASGWYANLFFENFSSVEFDPTIADVHTQPTDEAGVPVGRVLHVGTGMPRQMVVTVETCTGPRAYVGLASSYFERVTEDFDRLDDLRWSDELLRATPVDVPWMRDVVVR